MLNLKKDLNVLKEIILHIERYLWTIFNDIF